MSDKLSADPPMLDEVEFKGLCDRVIKRWHVYDPEFSDTVFRDTWCACILGPPCEPPHDTVMMRGDIVVGVCAPFECGRFDGLSRRECEMLVLLLRERFPAPAVWEIRTSRHTIEDRRPS